MTPHSKPPAAAWPLKLQPYHRNVAEQELLNDLKQAAARGGGKPLTAKKYDETGKFTSGTICRRFGSWNKALRKAGLTPGCLQKITDDELFRNMETVWRQLGRQPRFKEMCKPLSQFTAGPYLKRFKSWNNSLAHFIEFMNTRSTHVMENEVEVAVGTLPMEEPVLKHKTKRAPGERLKVQVLMRDGNRCRLCGKKLTGDNIQFDHIIPWCRGGETVLENLQVLCKKHNYAKGSVVL
jgi:hypothetical protein